MNLEAWLIWKFPHGLPNPAAVRKYEHTLRALYHEARREGYSPFGRFDLRNDAKNDPARH